MTKLAKFLPQAELIDALAHRVKSRFPEKGTCAYIARDLVKELKARGIFAKHTNGNFHLDQPASYLFISPLDTENDEYTIDHDWVEVEGVIIDPAASQFRKYVDQDIPEVVIANHAHPLYKRYTFIKYV